MADLLEEAALTVEDPVYARFARGRLLDLQGKHDDAVLELQQAASLAPGDVDVHYHLGLALKHAGHLEGAKDVFTRTAEKHPESFWTLAALGNTCLNMSQWEEALEWFDRAKMLRNDVSAVHSSRGLALYRLGRVHEARAALVAALQLEPSNSFARRLLLQLDGDSR
jgi:Flp pilus assembly protein TadD